MPDQDRGRKQAMTEPLAFKDHFSAHAAAYAAARPGYPPELFSWLAENAAARDCAWDCATGNGQAARALAERFAHVIATDASGEQIAQAAAHPRIEYRIAAAESPGLAPASVDLVTVAQAVHWFDRPRFYAIARAVLRTDGMLAVWSYGLFPITREIDGLIGKFYDGAIGSYWPPERHLIDEGYASLNFPFAEITAPAFRMCEHWTLVQVLAYLRTWSAVERYRRAVGRDPVAAIAAKLERLWGDPPRREVSWPLYLRVGRNSS